MISFYVHVKASFDFNVTRERGVNLNVILEKASFMPRNLAIELTLLWSRQRDFFFASSHHPAQ